jgi:sulfoxide reductase heme-binding subunit YedZ
LSDRIVRFVLKPIVFAASLVPVVWLAWAALTGNLSANPLSDLTNETGVWALRFVCITLAITPLRWLTGWNALIKFRRMAGLYAFFYGSLHFLVYVVADRFASLDFPNGEIVVFSTWTMRHLAASIWDDIYKRPFITVGFTALMTMLPLALTSTAGMIRRLGGRAWNRLHKLVYLTGMLVVVHYYWLVKADVSRPLAYGAIVAVLLGTRAWRYLTAMRPSTRGAISRRAAT